MLKNAFNNKLSADLKLSKAQISRIVQSGRFSGNFIKITEMEKKLTDHNHEKYITLPDFYTLAGDVFNARLA